MRQGYNNTLNWKDEEQDSIRLSGDNFWRSVWKGIENNTPRRTIAQPKREPGIEPPRDYVVDAEQGVHR